MAFLILPSWFSTIFLKTVVEIMTSELPLVCELLLGVSKGMSPVKHLAQRIIVVVNYCWHQLARSLGWATPAYHNKEGASSFSKRASIVFSIMGGADGHFGVRVRTWRGRRSL